MKLVDRIIRPREENGSDYESPRFVLVRKGNRELWWWTAHSSWVHIGRYESYPGSLVIAEVLPRPEQNIEQTIHRGGRLSAALIREHAKKIDTFFGEPVAGYISIKRTLILDQP